MLKLSGAYLAFLIGSGFATGQEAMQYFVAYGVQGLLGIIACCALMAYTCWSLLRSGYHNAFETNEEVFRHFCGPYLGVFMTWYTMVLIVAVHAVMMAGAAATLEQAYDIPVLLGATLMAALSAATLLLGLDRILSVLAGIGPLIILLTIATACVALLKQPGTVSAGLEESATLEILRASDHWLYSALLYVGLTLPGLAGFLPLVGTTIHSRVEVRAIATFAPVLFMFAMVLVVLALFAQLGDVYTTEVPIMALADNVLPIYGSVFALVIFLGIYTTITPLLWTVCRRFAPENTRVYRGLVVGLTLVGWLGGVMLPFGQLLNWIYPTVGYVGLLFLGFLLYNDLFKERLAR